MAKSADSLPRGLYIFILNTDDIEAILVMRKAMEPNPAVQQLLVHPEITNAVNEALNAKWEGQQDRIKREMDEQKKELTVSFSQIVSFLNKGALMQKLQNVPPNSKVKMSAKKCYEMSKEIQEVIVDFRDITSKTNNIELELIGFEKFDHIAEE